MVPDRGNGAHWAPFLLDVAQSDCVPILVGMAIHRALLDMVRELTAPTHPDFAALVMARHYARSMALTLAGGVDPNSEHPNGHTLLHADDLSADVVRLLILAGADVDACHYGALLRTPLFFATQPGVATLLVQAGADLEARDMDGLTPLMFQAAYNAPLIVDELLTLGADPSSYDTGGLDCLDHASVHLSDDDYAHMKQVVQRHMARKRRDALLAQLQEKGDETTQRRF